MSSSGRSIIHASINWWNTPPAFGQSLDPATGWRRARSCGPCQQNDAVGILIDQNTSPQEGAFVNFFGTPACANTGFAKIAARTGTTVIPGFALWSPGEQRYILRFYPPLENVRRRDRHPPSTRRIRGRHPRTARPVALDPTAAGKPGLRASPQSAGPLHQPLPRFSIPLG